MTCRRRRGVAWTRVSERATTVHASRRAASSLARCCAAASPFVPTPFVPTRRCDGARAHDARQIGRRGDAHTQQHQQQQQRGGARWRCMRACDGCAPPDACAQARKRAGCMRARRGACARGASPYAQACERRQPVEGVRRNKRDLVVAERPARARRGDASVVGGAVSVSQAARRGVEEHERASAPQARMQCMESACRLEPRSLMRCCAAACARTSGARRRIGAARAKKCAGCERGMAWTRAAVRTTPEAPTARRRRPRESP